MNFLSDNAAPIAPAVLQAIVQANDGFAIAIVMTSGLDQLSVICRSCSSAKWRRSLCRPGQQRTRWHSRTSSANELPQQSTDFLRLLLLYPMSRTINQTSTAPLGTCGALHSLERTWVLVDTPIALTGNKTGRHIDGAARKHFKLRRIFAAASSVPLQASLKSSATKFRGIDS